MKADKKSSPGGCIPGLRRIKRMQGKANTSPRFHYITGGSGVQVEDALYELEKNSQRRPINHIDEAKRRREIADRLWI